MNFLTANADRFGVLQSDLTQSFGVNHIYLRQKVHGLEVANSGNITVSPNSSAANSSARPAEITGVTGVAG